MVAANLVLQAQRNFYVMKYAKLALMNIPMFIFSIPAYVLN